MKVLNIIQKDFQILKPFVNKYNWGGINHQSKTDHWKKFGKNSPTIALNILYTKEKEIFPAFISKDKSTCEKQIILLMIPSEEKEGWHYLAEKKNLHKKTSKRKGDFYCLNCLNSLTTKHRLKSHEKVCGSKDSCGIVMPSEKKILEFNQYMKSDKMQYFIYSDVEYLIREINRCENNPEFDLLENKDTLYCGKDCMKNVL